MNCWNYVLSKFPLRAAAVMKNFQNGVGVIELEHVKLFLYLIFALDCLGNQRLGPCACIIGFVASGTQCSHFIGDFG